MKRLFDPQVIELMDLEQPPSAELEQDLRNLEKLNRHFGSHRLMRGFLRCWLKPGGSYRILDLATGGGDLPRMIVDWARQRGVKVKIDALDAQASTLEIARRWSAAYPEITFEKADIRTYHSAQSYDLVCCSLALHHFSDEDAVQVLKRARALSHDKVLVADLERTVFTWLSVYLLTTFFFTEPMTRHDARLSVQRAFSYPELAELAVQAGWESFGQERFFPARQAIWISSRQAAGELGLASDLDFAM